MIWIENQLLLNSNQLIVIKKCIDFEKKSIKEFYIKNGLIYGSINVIYLMITYVMGVDTMTSYGNIGLSMLLGLTLMVYFGMQVRKEKGGYMTVGEGFKSLIVIYSIATFLYLIFNH